MKRRSALPFVVEVKSTRSSRSSLAKSFTRTSSPAGLWHGVSISDPVPTSIAEPFPRAAASAEAAMLDVQPARRILPVIAPLRVPAEPDLQDRGEVVAPRVPAARAKRKPRAAPGPVATFQPSTLATASLAAIDEGFIEPIPESVPVSSKLSRISETRLDRHLRERPPSQLRRGERWKRRLPRSCW